MKNKSIKKKVAKVLINLGETHANEFSTLLGFYEPKVSVDLLKKEK